MYDPLIPSNTKNEQGDSDNNNLGESNMIEEIHPSSNFGGQCSP